MVRLICNRVSDALEDALGVPRTTNAVLGEQARLALGTTNQARLGHG